MHIVSDYMCNSSMIAHDTIDVMAVVECTDKSMRLNMRHWGCRSICSLLLSRTDDMMLVLEQQSQSPSLLGEPRDAAAIFAGQFWIQTTVTGSTLVACNENA